MANNCTNNIFVIGPTASLERIRDMFICPEPTLGNIVKPAEETTEAYDAAWGVHWDILDNPELVEDVSGTAPDEPQIRFDTAWTAPCKVFAKLTEQFPDCRFQFASTEPLMDIYIECSGSSKGFTENHGHVSDYMTEQSKKNAIIDRILTLGYSTDECDIDAIFAEIEASDDDPYTFDCGEVFLFGDADDIIEAHYLEKNRIKTETSNGGTLFHLRIQS